MNSIAKTDNHVPATQGNVDPFLSYGQETTTGTPFLKFIKGEYLFGTDDEKLPLGTRLAPNMAELKTGWLKWRDGEPVDERMACVASGERAPVREELGDLDKNLWDTDDGGALVDPWQVTNVLRLKSPETGAEFVFSTSSKGGIGAIGKLCTAYGGERHKHDGKLPVIELQIGSYLHRRYGEVKFPKFPIVGWADEGKLIAGEETTVADDLNDEIPGF
jgi:hypothetical protein